MNFYGRCYLGEDGVLTVATKDGWLNKLPLESVESIRHEVAGNRTKVKIKSEMSGKTFFAFCSNDETREIIDAWEVAKNGRTRNTVFEKDQTQSAPIPELL